MKEHEIPTKPVYNGESVCPFPLDGTEDAFYSRRQWFFEKAYYDSPACCGVSFKDRFLKGSGFDQYQFFKGQKEDPYPPGTEASTWWEFERKHWRFKPTPPFVFPFMLYFRNWIADKAAPDQGVNLEYQRNVWLDRYLSEAV